MTGDRKALAGRDWLGPAASLGATSSQNALGGYSHESI